MGNPGAIRQPSSLTRGDSGQAVFSPPDSPGAAAAAHSLESYLHGLADEILLLAGGDGAAIALREGGELRCRASSGIAPPLGARIDGRSGLTGACLSAGTLLRCDDSEADARVDRQVCRALGIRAMVCVPVTAGEEVVGIFEVFSSRPNAFLKVDVSALHAKAEEIADAFSVGEALTRAAVVSTADLGATGILASSWRPAPGPAPRRRVSRFSPRTWQALLGAMVLAVGVFLFLRAIRASGPAASAWAGPQTASAAPPAVETDPAVESRLNSPRRPRPRATAGTDAGGEQTLALKPASIPAPTAGTSAEAPAPPPEILIATEAPGSNPLHELVSSIPAAQPALPAHLRVSSGVPEPVLLQRVAPQYPALARQNGIEGAVVLEGLVNKNGQVIRLRVDSGNSLLVTAALRAVHQWRYRPPRLNGEAVEVPIKIVLKFELGR